MSWQDFAACTGREDIDWVPTQETRGGMTLTAVENLAAARAVCASCPVRGLCLDEALRDHLSGIWGGTTNGERRRMRASRRTLEHRRLYLLAQLEREVAR